MFLLILRTHRRHLDPVQFQQSTSPLFDLGSAPKLEMKLLEILHRKTQSQNRLICPVLSQSLVENGFGVPRFGNSPWPHSTCFKCFLIRIEPFNVHLVNLRLASPSAYCGVAPFFSFTQISISANKKHSSSCHDCRSLPTLTVP